MTTIVIASACQKQLHRQINAENVESVILWGGKIPEGTDGRNATEIEQHLIVDWFNSATDIRENKSKRGKSPLAGIRIQLKSREVIEIRYGSGEDFEVFRNNQNPYWAVQPNLRELFEELGGK